MIHIISLYYYLIFDKFTLLTSLNTINKIDCFYFTIIFSYTNSFSESLKLKKANYLNKKKATSNRSGFSQINLN